MNIGNIKNNHINIYHNPISSKVNEKDNIKENEASSVIDKNVVISKSDSNESKNGFNIWENLDFIFYKVFKPLLGISKGIKELLKSSFFLESLSKLAKDSGVYITGASLVTNTYIFLKEASKVKKDGVVTKEELFELVGKGVGLYSGDIIGGMVGKLAGSALGAIVGSVIPVAGTFSGAAVGGAIGKALGTALGSIYGKDLFKKIFV
ncbi:MAG: hypothetical protein RMJ36_07065 [Candidatus Calescibacterium sp.]|nr:hypothetical protein [Candidatus Calescibacterium sp.]MDW8133395.1 hypothetical protein [Candidatus Calescibacterium sp.]